MDKLQQVKAKLEEMKAKYNFERENEDNPNHSDGCGMFYSGFFTCLKEISFFLDTLEVKEKEVDLKKEIKNSIDNLPNLYCYMEDLFNGNEEEGVYPIPEKVTNELFEFAKHFYELGLKEQLKNK